MQTDVDYVLGSDPAELARLDAQATQIAPATRTLLRAAGIRPGMRVLDLGTGLGHVAGELAELVGPSGEVVGIDVSADHLAAAEARRTAANVRFVEADVRTYADGEFDAVVGRLLLFHTADPLGVLRHHAEALTFGGRIVALDYDLGACRTEPAVELVMSRHAWVVEAFRRAGADPLIGSKLPRLLRDAGLDQITSLAMQRYYAPGDPDGAGQLAAVVRSLAPQIVATGIATAEELDLEHYGDRVIQVLTDADSVFLAPALVGAWGVSAR